MKNVDVSKTGNKATFYVDTCGDIHDTLDKADVIGVAGSVTLDNGYPGSIDKMREVALEIYSERAS